VQDETDHGPADDERDQNADSDGGDLEPAHPQLPLSTRSRLRPSPGGLAPEDLSSLAILPDLPALAER
jgi:hypothetical protein